ncbi:hypothetical protein D8M35_00715 [Curtobacterium sp. HSID17257]|nr:hypothetical protein D8M35_00715 [Curtobacterium sp. HSID17257]
MIGVAATVPTTYHAASAAPVAKVPVTRMLVVVRATAAMRTGARISDATAEYLQKAGDRRTARSGEVRVMPRM